MEFFDYIEDCYLVEIGQEFVDKNYRVIRFFVGKFEPPDDKVGNTYGKYSVSECGMVEDKLKQRYLRNELIQSVIAHYLGSDVIERREAEEEVYGDRIESDPHILLRILFAVDEVADGYVVKVIDKTLHFRPGSIIRIYDRDHEIDEVAERRSSDIDPDGIPIRYDILE